MQSEKQQIEKPAPWYHGKIEAASVNVLRIAIEEASGMSNLFFLDVGKTRVTITYDAYSAWGRLRYPLLPPLFGSDTESRLVLNWPTGGTAKYVDSESDRWRRDHTEYIHDVIQSEIWDRVLRTWWNPSTGQWEERETAR